MYDLSSPVPDSVLTKNNVFPVNTRTLTSYLYPFQVSKDQLLYLKTSTASGSISIEKMPASALSGSWILVSKTSIVLKAN